MTRYFGKIDENNNDIEWELYKTSNEILIVWGERPYYSPLCLNVEGNLFAVFDEIEEYKFKVLFLSESPDGMLEYFDINEFTSADAFRWAYHIGNKDVMIDRITESQYACYWGVNIGNHDVMIDKITESKYAFLWAKYIGNKDVMIDRITDSEYSYWWAQDIGDRKIMKEKITDKRWMKEFEQLP